MFTHRLYLHDGLTLLTEEQKAAIEQIKQDVQASAKAAADSAASAQEFSNAIDPDRIDANIEMKADNFEVDPDTKLLYLTSNGVRIGDGIEVPTGAGNNNSANNAILTLRNTTGWTYKNISQSSNCRIKFNWTSTEDGVSTGEGVVTVRVGGILRYSAAIAQGDIEIDPSSYLSNGSNVVRVNVSDIYGNSRTLAFTINMISLTLSSTFDSGLAYTGAIAFPYIPVGAVEKTVHFVLDGVEIGHTVTNVSGRQLTFTIPAQPHGSHSLFVYFDAEIDGETIPSNSLFYDIVCVEDNNNTPIITSSFRVVETEQYVTFSIPYTVYVPQSLTGVISLWANGKQIGSELTVDRTQQTWTYRPDETGSLELKIMCGDVSKEFKMNVTESQVKVEAETEALGLHLTSHGRSNNEADPDVWDYGDISVEFSNFNFVSDGWKQDEDGIDVMRVTGDARLYIPYMMFASDFRTTGKTLEFELATRDVLNYDAEVIGCYSGNRGYKITAQQLHLSSAQSTLGGRYKEDEHIRVTFTVEKKSENRLILCYINGIMSGAVQYPEDDDFSQTIPVGITIGSNECTTDIYNIRVYDNNLTRHQVLDNWIADTQIAKDRIERFGRNDIYDDYSQIVIEKLPNDLCYMVIQAADLPQFKGDKKTCSGYFVNPQDPTRDFSWTEAQIDVQGTSSQYYYRKNYKLKYDNGFVLSDDTTSETYQMNDDAVPTNVFTMKADVASSEGAFNVILSMLYNDLCPFKTPAQEEDYKVRQTIEGFPMVIFWDNGSETKFLGKYNFNNDKATAEVFGFKDGDESWEILQNGTDRVGWHSADFSGDGWKTDFEARYPEDNVDTTRLKVLAEWLVSTDTDQATDEALGTAVTYDGVTYTTDSKDYRLAKFSAELKDHFIEEAIIFYYLYTEMFLSIDQREKNAFPTYLKDLDRWIVLFYDADSSCGTDNKGNLAFDYYLEDIDHTEGGDPIYNGQNSVLWKNLRETRYDEIMEMYQNLRTSGAVNYDSTIEMFENHQDKWPEAIFNEDMYTKCLEPLINDGDGIYLPMLQGKKEQWMKWWLYNRFRYLDSKYLTGTSMENRITIRTHAQANISLMAYVNMYGHVYYNAEMVEHRMNRGEEYEFVWSASGAEDAVIGINDADMLTSLGDLSPLMVELIDVSGATHITSLKIGDGAEDYVNYSMSSITLGNNKLLRSLDLRNCPNLVSTPDLSGCTNIEEILCEGSGITGLKLPSGGIVKTLHLPETVVNLTIRNQNNLTDFIIPNYSNITTLWLENNSDIIDPLAIFESIQENSRVRIIGFTYEADSVDDVFALYDKFDTMRGLDENGNNTDKPQVSGTIYIDEITGSELAEMQSRYSTIKIEYNRLISYLYFYDDTGTTLLYTAEVKDGGDGVYSGSTPTKTSTAQYSYSFAGWSTTLGGDADNNALTAITVDRNVYAAFAAAVRTYTVKFYNGTTVLQMFTDVPYGSSVSYSGDDPIYIGDTPEDYEFYGFSPNGNNIVGDTNCYAQYIYTGSVSRELIKRTLSGPYTNDRVTIVGSYAFYKCSKLTSVDLPNVTSIDTDAFENCSALTTVDLPNAKSIGINAFRDCSKLTSVDLPNVTSIDSNVFYKCSKLTSVDLPNVTSIGSGAFYSCSKLTSVDLPNAKSIDTNAFYDCSALTSVDLPKVTGIGQYAFNNCSALTSVDLPNVTSIGINAFRGCSALTSIDLPNITSISSNAFYSCSELTTVDLPNVTTIGQYAFYSCSALTTVDLPNAKSIGTNAFRGCSALTSIDLPNITSIGSEAFYRCSELTSIIIRTNTCCKLSGTIAFNSTPISSGTGYIYVPSTLLEEYKVATNWSAYANQFRAIEDYPDICGGVE